MRSRLIAGTLAAGLALAGPSGAVTAQTAAAPESPAAEPAPAACPKGYEALCGALTAPVPGGRLGSQAGTGGKSTVLVHPEALQQGGGGTGGAR